MSRRPDRRKTTDQMKREVEARLAAIQKRVRLIEQEIAEAKR